MKIGIDISQIVYEGTGVSAYVRHMTETMVRRYPMHRFVLFGSSFRKRSALSAFASSLCNTFPNVRAVIVPFPPMVLDILWNRLHIVPVTWFVGNADVFWSSDWTQPPVGNAIGVTTVHDVSIMRYPEESSKTIVATHTRRLRRAKRSCRIFFADSESTKRDMETFLGVAASSIKVVYPGYDKRV